MLPIAIAVGGFCGAMCGGIGVVIGTFWIKNNINKRKQPQKHKKFN